MKITDVADLFQTVHDNVTRVIHGKDEEVRLVLVALIAGGHVLVEDVPGVGKSVLARAVAQSIGGTVGRIQCTPDLLPVDITGASVIDLETREYWFREGPVFANVVLVDEINRATPKTQSGLLEAMAERHVSVDGERWPLPEPFCVLATQNPVELAGTFPLPEAQLDRFLLKLSLGYPDLDSEIVVARENAAGLAVEHVEAVVEGADVLEARAAAATVEVPEVVERHLVELVRATRTDDAVAIGAGPRGSIALLSAGRVLAACDGRDVVYPDDVRALAVPALGHRILLRPDAALAGDTVDDVVARALASVPAPAGFADDTADRPRRVLVMKRAGR